MGTMRIATRPLLCMLPLLCTLVGCSVEAPELPAFETQLRIPISEKRYTLAELVEDPE